MYAYHSSDDLSEAPEGLVFALKSDQQHRKNVIHTLDVAWKIKSSGSVIIHTDR